MFSDVEASGGENLLTGVVVPKPVVAAGGEVDGGVTTITGGDSMALNESMEGSFHRGEGEMHPLPVRDLGMSLPPSLAPTLFPSPRIPLSIFFPPSLLLPSPRVDRASCGDRPPGDDRAHCRPCCPTHGHV